jgi:hypothetical protein
MSDSRKIPAAESALKPASKPASKLASKLMTALTLLLLSSFLPGNVSRLKAARLNSSAQKQTLPEAIKLRKLKPSDFRELPAKISRELARRGCEVPQVSLEGYAPPEPPKPHNVVSGEFASRGQKDWAVLCSRRGRTAIHILWGGPTRCASVIGSGPDDASRYLSMADAKYIRDHYAYYGGPKPPPLLHQGINDGIAEKASQVWYCYRGKWRVLQGAD